MFKSFHPDQNKIMNVFEFIDEDGNEYIYLYRNRPEINDILNKIKQETHKPGLMPSKMFLYECPLED